MSIYTYITHKCLYIKSMQSLPLPLGFPSLYPHPLRFPVPLYYPQENINIPKKNRYINCVGLLCQLCSSYIPLS